MPRLTSAARVAALRADWLAGEKTDVIVLRHGITPGALFKIRAREGWPRRSRGFRSRWQGPELERLEAAWRDDPRSRDALAAAFGVPVETLKRLARRHGWPPRKPGRRPGRAAGKWRFFGHLRNRSRTLARAGA
jgi:hypothetical protein